MPCYFVYYGLVIFLHYLTLHIFIEDLDNDTEDRDSLEDFQSSMFLLFSSKYVFKYEYNHLTHFLLLASLYAP